MRKTEVWKHQHANSFSSPRVSLTLSFPIFNFGWMPSHMPSKLCFPPVLPLKVILEASNCIPSLTVLGSSVGISRLSKPASGTAGSRCLNDVIRHLCPSAGYLSHALVSSLGNLSTHGRRRASAAPHLDSLANPAEGKGFNPQNSDKSSQSAPPWCAQLSNNL